MNVFLSYASQYKDRVRPVCSTLRAAGFELFFDETDLPAGQVYDDRIRQAIQRSDLFVFVLSPEAVEPGRYTLTELLFAAERWPSPLGHVLTVLPLGTPEPPLPDYLRPITLQKQVGNLAAEILATLRRMEADLAPPATADPAPDPDASPAASLSSEGSYLSLDIHFREASDHGFTMGLDGAAQAPDAPLASVADVGAIEAALWTGAVPFAGVVRRGSTTASQVGLLPSAAAAREVGQRLHAWLFAPHLRDSLQVPLRNIDRQRGQGLRFVINTTEAPALARLPWEFTYDPKRRDFIFADTMKPLVRWLDVDEQLPTLAVQAPLRLLIAVSSPADQPALAVGEELAQLDRALESLSAQGLVHTEVLPHTSVTLLEEALVRLKPHVLHFVGHGDFVGDEGTLLLEADAPGGATVALTGQRLAVLLRNHLRSLRLVFLNSCLGAAASQRDPFGGVAQALVGHGVPAVIAMQFPIPDTTATDLARQFYRYLASGRPVDESLTAVRAYLYAKGCEVEWGAPVLTLRVPDGKLFDFGVASPPLVALDATPPLRPQAPTASEHKPESLAPPPTTGATPAGADAPLAPAAASSPSASRAPVLIAGVLLLLTMAGSGLWWVMSGNSANDVEDPMPAPVVEAPLPAPVVVPAPLPEQDDYSALDAALSQADAQLDAGNPVAALTTVEGALLSLNSSGAGPLPAEQVGKVGQRLSRIGKTLPPGQLDRLMPLAIGLGDDAAAAGLMDELMSRFPTAAGAPAPAAGGPGQWALRPHVVRPGDTLSAIARLRYGDARRWSEIFVANRDQLKNPDRIEAGQSLRIPPHASTHVDQAYLVRPGDSLWRLAARFYGDGRLWPRLVSAIDGRRLSDPDLIQPGQRLLIPSAR